jgi:hypothetical protein
MCSITDMAENLREATAMLSRNADTMSPMDLRTSLRMVEALASVLKDEVDDMNHINALHEFYLARSEHIEGLNIEVE